MNLILFLSLVIILSAALPWWPYSAYGRSRHHRPWDWLLDTPSREDSCIVATESRTRPVHRTWLEALGRGATPEASQIAAMRQASKNAAMKLCAMRQASQNEAIKLCDSNSETPLMRDDLLREFKERWVALETTNNFDDGRVAADGPTEPAGDNAPSSKERKVIQSGVFEGRSFSIFDDGSIEIETGSGLQEFKDFAELRAVAAARISHDGTGQTNPRSPRETKSAATPAGHG
jgi:hypothetical protein